MAIRNIDARINLVYQFFMLKPGYLKKSYEMVSKLTGERDFTVIKAARELVNKPVKNKLKNRITKPGTYWITGCAHAPWHNKAMYESTFNFLDKVVLLDGIILAGDFVDLNSLSAHDKGKIPLRGVNLEWEYEQANLFLDEIQDLVRLDDFELKYIFGNHEDRYLRMSKDVDNSKYGNALIGPVQGLRLEERGYDVFTNWKNDCVGIGEHLDVNHGEFLNVHSAKKTIDTYRKSVLYFHTHRYQVYLEGNVGGWNMGSGADFDAPIFNYATRAMKNSWVNASALVTLDDDGFYHVEPLLFINNKLVVGGYQY
jgi:hypothetical protein